MDQIIESPGSQTGYDASGPYWYIGYIRILSGKLWFHVDGKNIAAPGKSFILSVPPSSVISLTLKNAKTINTAVFSRLAPHPGMHSTPIAYTIGEFNGFKSNKDVEKVINAAEKSTNISRTSQPHPLSKQLKDYLECHFTENEPMSALARRFQTSPAVLSRLFHRDWGKPPVKFRNWLRIMDSFRHIAQKTAITDIAYDVGFNDLSRFHKQFKETVRFTPLTIRKKSKNAKIS